MGVNKMIYKVSIVKNENGSWIFTGGFPVYCNGLTEGLAGAIEKECGRLLTENPILSVLFQNGAILEACILDAPRERVRARIKIEIESDGLITFYDDTPCCTFYVQMKSLEKV
jgi:hypothetical protein